jgi:transcriptional regulator with XRE-family HTH domain
MTLEISFGELVKKARKDKGYSQKELAKILGVDFTYLSKLENHRADYAPKEEVIRGLAHYLGLDKDELMFLAGRIPQRDEEWMKQHYQNMPTLLRRMRENPKFAEKVFRQAMEGE